MFFWKPLNFSPSWKYVILQYSIRFRNKCYFHYHVTAVTFQLLWFQIEKMCCCSMISEIVKQFLKDCELDTLDIVWRVIFSLQVPVSAPVTMAPYGIPVCTGPHQITMCTAAGHLPVCNSQPTWSIPACNVQIPASCGVQQIPSCNIQQIPIHPTSIPPMFHPSHSANHIPQHHLASRPPQFAGTTHPVSVPPHLDFW